MRQYLDLIDDVLENGNPRDDRTGTGTLSVFGRQVRFDLSDGFPIITTKKVHMKSVIHELLWFLSGSTNIRYLKENKVRIWDEWADENGDLGRVYGAQWRTWHTARDTYIDQIRNVIDNIKKNPNSRRHMVVAWNPGDLKLMALPPCHCLFQFYVYDGKLSCQLYQRSADLFLGVPFNISSYALLTMMIAHVTGLEAGEFIHTFGDLHLYIDHCHQVNLQKTREPYPLPKMLINPAVTDIDEFTYGDFYLEYYKHHPHIKGVVSV